MMRKLAVVFVLSLAAVGCGSDNGTPNKADTGTTEVSKPGVDMGKDSTVIDTSITNDTAMDQAAPDTQVNGEVQAEAGQVNEAGQKPETKIDGGTDTTKVDGGVDTQVGEAGQTVDTSAAVDGGVDGGALD